MERLALFGVFSVIMFVVLGCAHWYVFRKVARIFSLKWKMWMYLVVFVLIVAFPVASMLYRVYDGVFGHVVYVIAATWVGVLFFTVVSFLILDVVKLFVRVPDAAWMIALVIVGLVSIGSIINYSTVTVKTVEIPVVSLQKEMTIVQLTDLHIGNTRTPAYLGRIVKMVNEVNPDVVVITGDLIDGTAPIQPGILDALDNIDVPVLYVLGNHELYAGLDEVLPLLNSTKLKVLRNEAVDFNGLQFVGVDYGVSLDTVLPTIPIHSPSVLLYHKPTDLSAVKTAGISLQLAGHTHAGQIIPISLIEKLIYKYPVGLFEEDGTWIYVSPGTGTWGPPMRLGSRNEVTVIHLTRG